MLDNLEPTLNSLVDIDDALKVWSKYWPILKTDQKSLELENTIKRKIEYRKHVLGSKTPQKIVFLSEQHEFKKSSVEKGEIEFWKVVAKNQADNQDATWRMLFASVCELGEDFVVCKDFRDG